MFLVPKCVPLCGRTQRSSHAMHCMLLYLYTHSLTKTLNVFWLSRRLQFKCIQIYWHSHIATSEHMKRLQVIIDPVNITFQTLELYYLREAKNKCTVILTKTIQVTPDLSRQCHEYSWIHSKVMYLSITPSLGVTPNKPALHSTGLKHLSFIVIFLLKCLFHLSCPQGLPYIFRHFLLLHLRIQLPYRLTKFKKETEKESKPPRACLPHCEQ